jgi:hypothetical protein
MVGASVLQRLGGTPDCVCDSLVNTLGQASALKSMVTYSNDRSVVKVARIQGRICHCV